MTLRPTPRSAEIFARAQAVIPGGVNSPVRACRQVGGEPLFIARGEGGRVGGMEIWKQSMGKLPASG